MIVWVATACGSKVVYHTLERRLRLGLERTGQRGVCINLDLLNPDRARPCKRCWPDE